LLKIITINLLSMKNKLNFFGVGPKIAKVLIPWLAIAIIASLASNYFIFTAEKVKVLKIIGTALLIFGMIFYLTTVKLLLKGLKETRLVTNGSFYLCQNPLYTAILLFIIPAVSLLLNSWLVLTSSLVGYILFKTYIRNEYQELEHFFGDEYLKYKNNTPEFFPLPIKKRMK